MLSNAIFPFSSNRINQGPTTTLPISGFSIDNCSFRVTFMLSALIKSLCKTWYGESHKERYNLLKNLGQAIKQLTRIREIIASNLVQDNDYPQKYYTTLFS